MSAVIQLSLSIINDPSMMCRRRQSIIDRYLQEKIHPRSNDIINNWFPSNRSHLCLPAINYTRKWWPKLMSFWKFDFWQRIRNNWLALICREEYWYTGWRFWISRTYFHDAFWYMANFKFNFNIMISRTKYSYNIPQNTIILHKYIDVMIISIK